MKFKSDSIWRQGEVKNKLDDSFIISIRHSVYKCFQNGRHHDSDFRNFIGVIEKAKPTIRDSQNFAFCVTPDKISSDNEIALSRYSKKPQQPFVISRFPLINGCIYSFSAKYAEDVETNLRIAELPGWVFPARVFQKIADISPILALGFEVSILYIMSLFE